MLWLTATFTHADTVRAMRLIMLMDVQLHDRPLWPSAVVPVIDQGRVSRARSGMSL